MTLFEKLISAGLPILRATEDGQYTTLPGALLTLNQYETLTDIILEHTDSAAYQVKLRCDARKAKAKAEAALALQLHKLTPAQAVNYIETNITDLASAKVTIKVMARMLIAIRDAVFPDLPE